MGPYQAKPNGAISYLGNRIYPPFEDVRKVSWPPKDLENRVRSIHKDRKWYHLHKIDASIFTATIEYFQKIGADWVNLPLTTLMISSPGEVYAGQQLNYTTDTLPVEIPNWFQTGHRVFLSESSQFYLELRLIIDGLDKVFSIYNSFRKEPADATHLSEFQHIEFEGHVDFDKNIETFTNLIDYILEFLLRNNEENLSFFLKNHDLNKLSQGVKKKIYKVPFVEILETLFKTTKNEKYKEFSMKNFGSWEEILITQIYGGHVLAINFPMLQIPFYHEIAEKIVKGIPVAENADLILEGYRETVGSGVRVASPKILAEKARIFNLPPDDYKPYLETRKFKNYKPSAGFGLGWQRFTQWLLKLPYIWEATPTPRGHTLPQP
jgi:aspartyl/asparaginyl-tRNA synthetase